MKELSTSQAESASQAMIPSHLLECSQHLRVLRSLVDAILGVIINAILWMEKWRKEEDGQQGFLQPSLCTEGMVGTWAMSR